MSSSNQYLKEYVYTKHLYKFEINEYYVKTFKGVKDVIMFKDLDFYTNRRFFCVPIEPNDFFEQIEQAYKDGYKYVEQKDIKHSYDDVMFIGEDDLRDVFVSTKVEPYDKSSIKSFLEEYIKDQWYSDFVVVEEAKTNTSKDKNYSVKIKYGYKGEKDGVILTFNETTGLIQNNGYKNEVEYDSDKKLSVNSCLLLSMMLEYDSFIEEYNKTGKETVRFIEYLTEMDYQINTFFYLNSTLADNHKVICRIVSEDGGVLNMYLDKDENVFKYAVTNSTTYLSFIIKHIDEYNKRNGKQDNKEFDYKYQY